MSPAPPIAPTAGVAYWEDRAQRLGARAVVSTDHPADGDLGAVTDGHRAVLLPALAGLLDGSEATVLDLGCGTGRLTADLAALVGGRAVGVDPVLGLLELAAEHPATTYRQSFGDTLPLADGEADVVFTLTVLGGLLGDAELAVMAAEIRRVLRPGGLLCLAESVSEPGAGAVAHWVPRTVGAYAAAFPWAGLAPVARFVDAGDPITVLAGRATA